VADGDIFFFLLMSSTETGLQGLIRDKTWFSVSTCRSLDACSSRGQSLDDVVALVIDIFWQVRSLLYNYLTDDEQGSVSGRNPIASINEILRDSKFSRDKTTVCYFITSAI
jgi:exocyst complex component 4